MWKHKGIALEKFALKRDSLGSCCPSCRPHCRHRLRWIFDAQFSIINWALMKKMEPDRQVHRLPRRALERALLGHRRQRLARCALRRDHAARGLQTISPSYYERGHRRRHAWQQFRRITLPLLTPIIAVVLTFSVLFTFTDFRDLRHHARRAAERDAPDGHAVLQRAISGGALGERGHLDRHGALPAGRHPVQLLRAAAPPGSRAPTNEPGQRHRLAWNTWNRAGASC